MIPGCELDRVDERVTTSTVKVTVAAVAALALAGCQFDEIADAKHLRPLSYASQAKLERLGLETMAPIMMRIYKQESELEIWKRNATGRYQLFKTYEICRWSGKLGPKFKEGDRQAPEGFYEITPALMNPNSKYYLSFNLGFPNPFDQAHDRTGTHLMVHGACSSRGCYAMTDEQMQEIYVMARDAFRGGQKSFQVQAFPFRMTAENFYQHRNSEHIGFWKMLKEGHDHFEAAKVPPTLDVCEGRYIFNASVDNEKKKFVADRKCPAYTVAPHVAGQVDRMKQEHEAELAALAAAEDRREARAEKIEAIGKKVTGLVGLGGKPDNVEEQGSAEAPAETASATD